MQLLDLTNINNLINYEVYSVDDSIDSVLKAIEFIEKSIFLSDLSMSNCFQDIGVSMLGSLYYSLHYLEQIILYQRSLTNLGYKLKENKYSRKDKINLEKKTDEMETLLFNAKNCLDSLLLYINKNFLKLNEFLTDGKYDSTMLYNFKIDVLEEFLLFIKKDKLMKKSLCLGFRLDKQDIYEGIFDYNYWFESESEYFSKLYSDIIFIYILPICISYNINSSIDKEIIIDELYCIYKHVVSFLGLDADIYDIFGESERFDMILSMIFKFFFNNNDSHRDHKKDHKKDHKIDDNIISSFQIKSFSKVIGDYCNKKLFNKLLLQFDTGILLEREKNINKNKFTKSFGFIYNS